MSFAQITDHVERAQESNLSQFRGLPGTGPTELSVWDALIKALVRQVQFAEDALWAVWLARVVDNATGWTLDKFGKLVGQPRGGLADEDYQRYIKARIATNRSKGTLPDLLTIARLILDDPTATVRALWQTPSEIHGPAALVVRIVGAPVTVEISDILIAFLRPAAAAGVRVILEYSSETPAATTFKWDTANRGWDRSMAFWDAKD